MATTRGQQVQRGYHYAIVDEVDSILIDEARTPLIISGPATISTHQYDKWKPLIEQLVRKQNMLCNRVASEAIEKFEHGDVETGGRLMFKVKLGQPRNKQLLRMMEDPDKRRAIDKAELSFYQDTRKEEIVAPAVLRRAGRAHSQHLAIVESVLLVRERRAVRARGQQGCHC